MRCEGSVERVEKGSEEKTTRRRKDLKLMGRGVEERERYEKKLQKSEKKN